ncbi:MAG TPA: carbohydrate ABC transporter permease [Chloroflexota bacterium]|nr:carbohydrate ABC transporter permease [Chloroflexota bacterium]
MAAQSGIASKPRIAAVHSVPSIPVVSKQLRGLMVAGTLSLFATLLVTVYLMPLGYAAALSVRSASVEAGQPLWPSDPAQFAYNGQTYDLYNVPVNGAVRTLALTKPGREASTFVDPANPTQPIEWQGRWRTLDRVWNFSPHWANFAEAWKITNFGRLFFNTVAIAVIGTIGAVSSAVVVAYGFSRFHIPGKSILFTILVGTIILPQQVTIVPTYAMFASIGWVGTWLPLLVPHFFGNAYNVFLLRQFFMSIPRDLDEAAMIDGASPFRTLISVILPQAWAAVIAVCLFHFFFAWNDFLAPLVYLVGHEELWPISVGMSYFTGQYTQLPQLIQATALMAMALPVLIFILAQKVFVQGVVVTGVDK